jgi:hypothetical protein
MKINTTSATEIFQKGFSFKLLLLIIFLGLGSLTVGFYLGTYYRLNTKNYLPAELDRDFK